MVAVDDNVCGPLIKLLSNISYWLCFTKQGILEWSCETTPVCKFDDVADCTIFLHDHFASDRSY
jgi:hypothetical protein